MESIVYEKKLTEEELIAGLKNITFRGLYDKEGNPLKPYANAKFSLVKVHPPTRPTSFPQIMHDLQPQPLFTAQPTIYKTQTDMLTTVDQFLRTQNRTINTLGFEAIQYNWEGRGKYHVMPPVIEKHTIPLQNGKFDLKKIQTMFKGAYVKDAKGNLHELSTDTIKDYYVDQESKVKYLPVFNNNAPLINYGIRFNGPHNFYIVCDGSHRMDYALEILNEPINAILVEADPLYPYYAFPTPFRPTTRLTSKEAEQMHPKLERDKIHLLNDFIKKVLHYNWETGGLYVSGLRQQKTIH